MPIDLETHTHVVVKKETRDLVNWLKWRMKAKAQYVVVEEALHLLKEKLEKEPAQPAQA